MEFGVMEVSPATALALVLVLPIAAFAAQRLESVAVTQGPAIDGRAEDPAWARAPEITTRDRVAGIDLRMRSVHTAGEIFVLARFPDADQNRAHRRLHWDAEVGEYRPGPEREDTLVLKWSMEPRPVDLRLDADNTYEADVWYWKAARTDPAGYADDKVHSYGRIPRGPARALVSRTGRRYFLTRRGDRGRPAYRTEIPLGFAGERVERYLPQPPQGSRADVRARGRWARGEWVVEFARRLDTGHQDDVAFRLGGEYQFGVSRFEVAGRPPEPGAEQPRFGAGDVGEVLTLVLLPGSAR